MSMIRFASEEICKKVMDNFLSWAPNSGFGAYIQKATDDKGGYFLIPTDSTKYALGNFLDAVLPNIAELKDIKYEICK